MGTMTIDGRKVEFTNERNVLTVIRNAGIDIPTLCYHSELSTFGGCRLCTVEDDRGRMFGSCSEEPRDGMVIYTNTGRLRKYRKLIIELMLASHNRDCTTCEKSGSCNLQTLAHRFGIQTVRFDNYKEQVPIDYSSPSIVRDPNKCILCGNCVRVCEELQGIGALGFAERGSNSMVMPAFDRKITDSDCVNCGQCRIFCPTGAISIHHNKGPVWDAIADPDVRVVAQIAPAVRVAVGDAFGLPKGRSTMGKIVNALHRMGFDEVYDTTFSADLTIMEETAEFLDHVANGGKLPLLTSCCPAWVKFVGDHFPEYTDNISTCRSPQGMLSAVVKEYFRDPENAKGKKTVMVSFMPCTAKKMEANRPNSYTKGEKDTDFVLTTSELIDMIRTTGIDFAELEPESSDIPFGFGSGGGVIFGVSGGVTEAVIRRLVPGHDKQTLESIAECGVRQDEFIREFSIPYNGMTVNICVVSGLANARKVMEQVRSGEKQYHLIEGMACRRGCVMGGGQPRLAGNRTKAARTEGIYRADSVSVIKKSDENPMLLSLYEGMLKGKEHELLHNHEYCSK
ncbi:MAG: [FeFe] hydrogenase, group A [Eubacteriales bacterium]|nr:[FeFe] hydrogenase, group A [Eubacteriales bacterium]